MGVTSVRPVRVAAAAAAALAVALGTTGCQALKDAARSSVSQPTESTSSGTASSSPTPTSSTSTTKGPARVPDAARKKTKDGAVAFTKFFWGQFNRSQTEPNAGVLTPLYNDTCSPCKAYTDGAQALVDNKQKYGDPPFSVQSVRADTLKGDTATVISDVDQTAAKVVDAQGNTLATATARSPRFLVTLAWSGNVWKVGNIEIVT